MGSKTKIEWTDATWSPVSGCSKVSEACEHCYAEAMARRFDKNWKPWTAANTAHNVRLHPERLEQPLHWRKPRKVFVCSVADLFHERVPYDYVDQVFATMGAAKRHTFQVLTKRPHKMFDYLTSFATRERTRKIAKSLGAKVQTDPFWITADLWEWPLPNVWLGATVENQRAAERILHLLQTPAALRFVSIEPMLGPINIVPYIGGRSYRCACGYKETEAEMVFLGGDDYRCHLCGQSAEIGPTLDWVIVGGESGPKARPMHPDWVRSIRDQCKNAGVPFFFKGWGEWAPNDLTGRPRRAKMVTLPPEAGKLHGMFRVGKKAAGRKLDGRTWEEMPK